MMYGWGAGGVDGWWMVIAMAIVAIAIVGSAWLIASRPAASTSVRPSADDILRERFARGEITREQFDEARRALR